MFNRKHPSQTADRCQQVLWTIIDKRISHPHEGDSSKHMESYHVPEHLAVIGSVMAFDAHTGAHRPRLLHTHIGRLAIGTKRLAVGRRQLNSRPFAEPQRVPHQLNTLEQLQPVGADDQLQRAGIQFNRVLSLGHLDRLQYSSAPASRLRLQRKPLALIRLEIDGKIQQQPANRPVRPTTQHFRLQRHQPARIVLQHHA